ncbi:hypothetical protein EW026_g6663 [Hermanssonia centrifuga]|uniref:Uncharacterized protein n=1 Tax=Hermanssonia centrifuga TaxID=98765 RepID=A0A4S4KAC0_9APHY|nr:hypothetical protein EW026_g6663 [Hermanssonia centrifuga]
MGNINFLCTGVDERYDGTEREIGFPQRSQTSPNSAAFQANVVETVMIASMCSQYTALGLRLIRLNL